MDSKAPSARIKCGPRSTFEQRGRRAKMLESGMRIVGMFAADKAKAVSRPENLSDGRERSLRGNV